MIRITESDCILYKYLFEEHLLEREVIKKYIWKDKNNSYIDDRISKLINNGYLKTIKHPTRKNAKLILATKKSLLALEMRNDIFEETYIKGNSKLININIKNYQIINSFDSRRILHDLFLTKARLELEKKGVDFWKSSKMFRREKETIFLDSEEKEKKEISLYPDGKFEYKQKKYFFEFDNHNGSSRYKKAVKVYQNNLIKNVVFIFKRDYIPQSFLDLLVVTNKGYYFGFYKDLEKENIELKNIIGDKLIIGSDKN